MGAGTVSTLGDWAAAIAELPVTGIPARTVIVPRLRVAHALKRELARIAPSALLGAQFLTPTLAAKEVASVAGLGLVGGEGALRPMRVRELFDQRPALSFFDGTLLRETRGWAQAFSRALDDVEAAALTPAQLRSHREPALDDLALVLDTVSQQSGASVTNAELLRRATAALQAGAAWPWRGPVLVVVSGHETAAQAAFLNALPGARFLLLEQRPASRSWAERVKRLFPSVSAAGVVEHPGTTELALLKRYLFEDPQVLADAKRPRSQGRDGSVELDEHSGVEAELEATADWVVRQIRAGRPLDRLAVLVAHAEPMVSLLRQRLQRIPFGAGTLPVFIAGGEAAVTTGTGTRLLSLLRGLETFLPAESFAELLTVLAVPDGMRPVRRDVAIDVVSRLGTLGGSPGKPESALDWLPAAERTRTELSERIAVLEKSLEQGGDPDAETRQLWELKRYLEALDKVLPSLRALQPVVQAVVDGAPLGSLWPAFEGFLVKSKGLRLPVDTLDVCFAWLGAVGRAAQDPRIAAAKGGRALAVCAETLRGLRRNVGRYGEPRLYIGTVRGAAGLGFDAVRFVGLAEGSIPPTLREDAVLPTPLRQKLSSWVLPTRESRALSEVHALFRVVMEASHHVTFSYPRADLSGSVHEPSSLFVEVAAALGRPNAVTGEKAAAVPRTRELERDAFQPARLDARASRLHHPVGVAAWLDRTAVLRADAPATWTATAALDPYRAHALHEEERGELDGYLAAAAVELVLPGLSPDGPLSASRLTTLLHCPHRYLLESVIGWKEAAEPQPSGSIDAATYGTLVHRVLERFGHDFGGRLAQLTEADAKQAILNIAEEELAALLRRYALMSEQVVAAQRERMRRDVLRYFAAEWSARATRTFVAVERGFGAKGGLPLDAGGASLYVHGFIDRLDIEAGSLLVRDYKTGKPRPFRGDDLVPVPAKDAQVGLYALVAKRLAKEWGTPSSVHAAYAYPSDHEKLRLFDGARADELLAATKGWLNVALGVLGSRTFPRQPTAEGCTFCSFKVVCGDRAPVRAGELLKEGKSPLETQLVAMWQLDAPDEGGKAKPKAPAKAKSTPAKARKVKS